MRSWKKTASAESVHAMWHDPSTFDPMRMGPPYLPGQDVRPGGVPKTAGHGLEIRELVASHRKKADAELDVLMKTNTEAPPMAELGALLAYLRATSFMHLTHHWQARGMAAYGDHLLFERLYTETLPMIDALAERAVGAGSVVHVNAVPQAMQLAFVVESLHSGASTNPGSEDMVRLSLHGVLRVLAVLREVYQRLEASGLLSHGTSNLLEDIADKHEGFAYLLNQRAATYGR